MVDLEGGGYFDFCGYRLIRHITVARGWGWGGERCNERGKVLCEDIC